MASLYEIDEAIRNFEFEIDEETGEILNPHGLDDLQMERDKKIENIGLYIKSLEAEKEAVKHEKENFAAREKTIGNKIDRLKDYLMYALEGQSFRTPRLIVGYRSSESVEISDEFLIPDEYCNFNVVRKPDKTLLKKSLKQGKEIMGATLVEKSNIQVK